MIASQSAPARPDPPIGQHTPRLASASCNTRLMPSCINRNKPAPARPDTPIGQLPHVAFGLLGCVSLPPCIDRNKPAPARPDPPIGQYTHDSCGLLECVSWPPHMKPLRRRQGLPATLQALAPPTCTRAYTRANASKARPHAARPTNKVSTQPPTIASA